MAEAACICFVIENCNLPSDVAGLRTSHSSAGTEALVPRLLEPEHHEANVLALPGAVPHKGHGPFVIAHNKDVAPELPLLDLIKVLNLPGELAVQAVWCQACTPGGSHCLSSQYAQQALSTRCTCRGC